MKSNPPFYTLSKEQQETKLAEQKAKKKARNIAQKERAAAKAQALETVEVQTTEAPITDVPAEEVVTPSTPDHHSEGEELEFRRRGEGHRRLMRKPKPPISRERAEELLKLVFTDEKELPPEHLLDFRLLMTNGILTEKDMLRLKEADVKRARKILKRGAHARSE